jgi:hypothetical protein
MLHKVKKFVKQSFKQSGRNENFKHFDRTVYWVRRIKPDVDEAIIIAAYAHDIARAFRKGDSKETFKNVEFDDPKILSEHQNEGAHIIGDFLQKENYDEQLINRIRNMVAHHEEGGDEESNLIKDADTISYLENNAERHIQLIPVLGKDKIKRKIDWMYDRLSFDKAKLFAKPFYEKVLKLLDTT